MASRSTGSDGGRPRARPRVRQAETPPWEFGVLVFLTMSALAVFPLL